MDVVYGFKRKIILAALLLAAAPTFAQVATPITQYRNSELAFKNVPCSSAPLNFTPTDIGQTSSIFIYTTTGTVSAIDVEIDGNPDDGAPGQPNLHWFRISDSSTTTAFGSVSANIWFPFLRGRIVSCTGTGTITAWYLSQVFGGNLPGVSPSPGPPPLVSFSCPKAVPFSVTGTGELKIASSTSLTKALHICNISFGLSTNVTVSIDTGTGTNCGTGTTTIFGPFPSDTLSVAEDFSFAAALTTSAGQDVCLNLGSSATAGGGLTLAEF